MREVREYASTLDDQFPYWLFFLTKQGLGLQRITYCFIPPHLSPNRCCGLADSARRDSLNLMDGGYPLACRRP
jgi:hypothetical protein